MPLSRDLLGDTRKESRYCLLRGRCRCNNPTCQSNWNLWCRPERKMSQSNKSYHAGHFDCGIHVGYSTGKAFKSIVSSISIRSAFVCAGARYRYLLGCSTSRRRCCAIHRSLGGNSNVSCERLLLCATILQQVKNRTDDNQQRQK